MSSDTPLWAPRPLNRDDWPPATPLSCLRNPPPSHYPVGIYAIPEISMVRKTEEGLIKDRFSYAVGLGRYPEITRGAILVNETGLPELLLHRDTHELIGVHAIGTGTTE